MMPRAPSPATDSPSTPTGTGAAAAAAAAAGHRHHQNQNQRPHIGFSIDFLVGQSDERSLLHKSFKSEAEDAPRSKDVKQNSKRLKMQKARPPSPDSPAAAAVAAAAAAAGSSTPNSSASNSPTLDPASSNSQFQSWNPSNNPAFPASSATSPYLDMATLASVRALYAQQQQQQQQQEVSPTLRSPPFFNQQSNSNVLMPTGANHAGLPPLFGVHGSNIAAAGHLPAFARPSDSLAQQWWLLAQARQQQQRILAAAAVSQRFPPGRPFLSLSLSLYLSLSVLACVPHLPLVFILCFICMCTTVNFFVRHDKLPFSSISFQIRTFIRRRNDKTTLHTFLTQHSKLEI